MCLGVCWCHLALLPVFQMGGTPVIMSVHTQASCKERQQHGRALPSGNATAPPARSSKTSGGIPGVKKRTRGTSGVWAGDRPSITPRVSPSSRPLRTEFCSLPRDDHQPSLTPLPSQRCDLAEGSLLTQRGAPHSRVWRSLALPRSTLGRLPGPMGSAEEGTRSKPTRERMGKTLQETSQWSC